MLFCSKLQVTSGGYVIVNCKKLLKDLSSEAGSTAVLNVFFQ